MIVIQRCRGNDALLEQVPRLDIGFHLNFWLAKLLAHWIHRQMVVGMSVFLPLTVLVLYAWRRRGYTVS